jgi:hypothetical protein
MSTVDTQWEFFCALTDFLDEARSWARSKGWKITLGDCYRDPRCPYGSKSSKHRRRLAIDLNLFDENGSYVTNESGHDILGELWEKSYGGIWGGNWSIKDYNHYEWPDK